MINTVMEIEILPDRSEAVNIKKATYKRIRGMWQKQLHCKQRMYDMLYGEKDERGLE